MSTKRITPLSKAVDRQLYIIGMTRMELARKLGITYNYICLILQGRNMLSIDIANRMAEIIEVNPRELRELALKKAI